MTSHFEDCSPAPKWLIVHPAMYADALRLVETKTIRHIGSYQLQEYKGERAWVRSDDWTPSMFWPRDTGYHLKDRITNNRHWRGRGWPKEMDRHRLWKRIGRPDPR